MKIGLIMLTSPIHEKTYINSTLSPFIQSLDKEFDVHTLNQDEFETADPETYDLQIVFIGTGGTENKFKEIYQELFDPVYLLTTSLHNSLPASMEILSWIKKQNGNGKILHGTSDQLVAEIKEIHTVTKVKKLISSVRLGVIGTPSDWLIASGVNREDVRKKWGIEFKDINLSELYARYDGYSSSMINQKTKEILDKTQGMNGITREDIATALRVYFALKDIVKDYELSAQTIRCFDLVTELQTTECLALSLLNNERIIPGCEGDIPATFSMMVAHYLTGKLPFMANPVEIDSENNQVVFAHCTIPTSITDSYLLRTHFESGIGVGIQGRLQSGPVTVIKIGGRALTRHFVEEGELVKNLSRPTACRTQIAVEFNREVEDYFLQDPIANHHVIIEGEHGHIIKTFMEQIQLPLV